MNYELAKQLKDAGFPQSGNSLHWQEDNGETLLSAYPPVFPGKYIYIPNLSDLIEACEKFYSLECNGFQVDKIDYSWRSAGGKSGHREYCFGNSAEEAVAKLWLSLNKNE